ncbi:MAG: caspase family protein [Pirellulales bacterium]
MSLRKLSLIVLLFGLLNGYKALAEEARKLHVVIAVDFKSNPPLPGQAANESNFTDLLKSVIHGYGDPEGEIFPGQVDPSRVAIETFGTNGLNPKEILDHFRNKKDIQENDVVLFYYSGHGATDPDKGHYLHTSGGDLLRSDLLTAMQSHKHRLTILLTDCCSSAADYSPEFAAEAGESILVLRSLLFNHKGVVDITGANYDDATKQGEFGWFVGYKLPEGGSEPGGGVFTMSLCNVISGTDFKKLDKDRDRQIGWEEILPHLRIAMDRNYQALKKDALAQIATSPDMKRIQNDLRNQKTQQPKVFQLAKLNGQVVNQIPVQPNRLFRFGVRVDGYFGRGVFVNEVINGTPATRIVVQEFNRGVPIQRQTAMIPGDVISFVNEQPTPNVARFLAELKKIPPGGELRIKGLDGSSRRMKSYTAKVKLP